MVSRHDEPATKGDLFGLSHEIDQKLDALDSKFTRALGVAVEEMTSRMRAVLKEGVEARFESLERRMTELETRLCDRMNLLERAIHDNSTDIQKVHAEVADLRRDLDRREGRIDDLERRMDVVEKRLGIRS